MKLSEMGFTVRVANIICSVVLGREVTSIPEHDNVSTADIVGNIKEVKEALSKKQYSELEHALRINASYGQKAET